MPLNRPKPIFASDLLKQEFANVATFNPPANPPALEIVNPQKDEAGLYPVFVKRSKWARKRLPPKVDDGKSFATGLLVHENGAYTDGCMCCLGFACKQLLGATDADLSRYGMPTALANDLKIDLSKTPLAGLRGKVEPNGNPQGSTYESMLATYNDTEMPDYFREREIKRIGRKAGLNFHFKD